MKKIISILTTAMVYFCVATVLALVVAISMLWFKDALDEDRLYRVLASLHGIDIMSLHVELAEQENQTELEQISHDDVIKARTMKSLNLDLREAAIDKGRLELLSLQTVLQENQELFDDVKKTYDQRLKEVAEEQQNESLQQLQRTLEVIKPDQAKEQIVMMLDDDAMDDVVTILKNMPTDKRKKIIGEFDQGEDAVTLHEILRQIRLGEPLASEIQETRDKLQQLGAN